MQHLNVGRVFNDVRTLQGNPHPEHVHRRSPIVLKCDVEEALRNKITLTLISVTEAVRTWSRREKAHAGIGDIVDCMPPRLRAYAWSDTLLACSVPGPPLSARDAITEQPAHSVTVAIWREQGVDGAQHPCRRAPESNGAMSKADAAVLLPDNAACSSRRTTHSLPSSSETDHTPPPRPSAECRQRERRPGMGQLGREAWGRHVRERAGVPGEVGTNCC